MKHKTDLNYMKDVFVKYVRVGSNSAENAGKVPSTEGQIELGKVIMGDFKKLGVTDATQDKNGYVIGRLPGNVKAPTVAFIAHLDTYPSTPGDNVVPIIHNNYNGRDITLPKDGTVIKVSDFPELREKEGKTIITSSGDTLLGGDDKCGIAICMEVAKFLLENKDFKHGDVAFVFTPDEEIGHGADLLDVKKLNAVCGYTLDGDSFGTIMNETFCADHLTVNIKGLDIHPGQAKDKMINSLRIAARFIEKLPMDARPETTEKRQGFLHPISITGEVSETKLGMLVRDFTVDGLKKFEAIAKKTADEVTKEFKGSSITMEIKEQYRNMKYELDKDPRVVNFAMQAMEECTGKKPHLDQARGGTDGSRLSYRGLLCPDIPNGMYAVHGKCEWVCLEEMGYNADVLKQLLSIWAKA